MFCRNCGTPLTADQAFCPKCGTQATPAPQQPVYQQPAQPVYQQPAQPTYQQPVQQPVYQQPAQPAYQQPVYQQPVTPAYVQPGRLLSEKEFYQRFAHKSVNTNVIVCGILTLLSAALSFGVGIWLEDPLSLVEAVLYVGLGIAMLVTKNRFVALVIMILGIAASIYGMVLTGTPTGLIALAFSIGAFTATYRVHKAYEQYKMTGAFPTAPVGGNR